MSVIMQLLISRHSYAMTSPLLPGICTVAWCESLAADSKSPLGLSSSYAIGSDSPTGVKMQTNDLCWPWLRKITASLKRCFSVTTWTSERGIGVLPPAISSLASQSKSIRLYKLLISCYAPYTHCTSLDLSKMGSIFFFFWRAWILTVAVSLAKNEFLSMVPNSSVSCFKEFKHMS